MCVSRLDENHVINPSLFKNVAIIIKAANQTIVSQAPFSAVTSSQVSTPDKSSKLKPIKAVAVALMGKLNNKFGTPAQHSNKTAKIANMMISSRLIVPMSDSFALANVTALGVFLILGGKTKYSTNGIKANATKPGINIAHAH